jgi:uncharacterized alkaline shock family protein YloU
LPGEKKSKRSRPAASQKRSARRAPKSRKSGQPASGAASKRKGAAKSSRAPAGEGEKGDRGKAGIEAAPAPEATPSPPAPAPEKAALKDTGELKFGPNIITEIAVREVSEVEGVAELTGGWRTKGVQVTEVEGEEGVYVLDVRVAVEYGVNCVALAESIRGRIAEAVGRMTGQSVRAINVHVTGIRDKGHREEPHEEGVPLGEEHGIDF